MHGVQPTIFRANSSLLRTNATSAARETVGWLLTGSEGARVNKLRTSPERQGFNPPYASEKGIRPLPAKGSEYLPGFGVKSVIGGKKVVLGSAETLKTLGMAAPSNTNLQGRAVWIGIDGDIAGAVVLRDGMREAAQGLALHDLGIQRVELATGDNEKSEACRVANLIDADGCHWGLKPEDKTAIVEDLGKKGPTVMVGDGINDALSLAAADVGVSMGCSKADLAIRSADIVVLREEAASIVTIVDTGKRLIRIIRQNYAWAIGFNTAGIALATAGVLAPWTAALLHHISSVGVVLNSARLVRPGRRKFGLEKRHGRLR